MREIAGKTVVITGASAGLGRAIALAFAKAGAKTGLIARTVESLDDTQQEIARTGKAVTAMAAADTADPAQMEQAASRIEAELGPFDIWINNAMETIFSRFIDITPDEYRRITDVNYLGYVHGTQEALKRMLPRNRGHIIQVGSALAYRSIPLQSAYCGSKFAIRGFTDSLRCELIYNKKTIDLTIVHMPALNTPQFSWARTHIDHPPKPVGIIFQPELGAEAVLHAARHPRREYWVGGSTIAAILGTMFFPGWMDKKIARMSYRQQWVKGQSQPPRRGNLFSAAPSALHATEGQFSSEAHTRSVSWDLVRFFTKWL